MALVSEIGEFGLIDKLGRLPYVRGIGDDCAVLTPPPGYDLVMTADALIEGVHFRLDWIGWENLGHKSVAVNFSDLASMAAVPAGILLTLGLRPETTVEDVLTFYEGMSSIVRAFGQEAAVLGGDIVASPLATSISVTAFGFVESGQAVPRGGARPGDDLYVTGTLGDSAAGLRLLQENTEGPDGYLRSWHNAPEPRVWEARAAHKTGALHAMMDISDGLAGDLGHMVRASGCGAILEEEAIPLSSDLREAARRFGWNPLDLALHGGEDYELLMAVPSDRGKDVTSAVDALNRKPLTRIGTIIEGSGIVLRRADGAEEPLTPKAFTHF